MTSIPASGGMIAEEDPAYMQVEVTKKLSRGVKYIKWPRRESSVPEDRVELD